MSDLISREAAIDVLKREQSHLERPITETRWFDFGMRKAQEVLNELPSVQPEQKRGKWIERDKYLQYCSRCMYMIRGDASKDIIKEFRYCPNCGARMEE